MQRLMEERSSHAYRTSATLSHAYSAGSSMVVSITFMKRVL
jgi:hypothetical protein